MNLFWIELGGGSNVYGKGVALVASDSEDQAEAAAIDFAKDRTGGELDRVVDVDLLPALAFNKRLRDGETKVIRFLSYVE